VRYDHDTGLAPWLSALQGKTTQQELCDRCGFTRHQVGRWMSGKTEIRLPEFLRLLDGMTGRVPQFVSLLVPIDEVPSLRSRHQLARRLQWLAIYKPWSSAILTLFKTAPYKALDTHQPQWLADRLGIDLDTVDECIEGLEQAGAVTLTESGHYTAIDAPTVTVRWIGRKNAATFDNVSAADRARFQRFWANIAVGRHEMARHGDTAHVQLFAVSKQDVLRIDALRKAFFKELRAIADNSEPCEELGLITMHHLRFGDPPDAG